MPTNTKATHIPPNFIPRVHSGLNAALFPEGIKLFTAWIRAEGGLADWNPLNSSLSLGPNWTDPEDYNSIPVRNYRYPNVGVCATVLTLSERNSDGTMKYGGIVADLQAGKKTAKQIVTDHLSEFQEWGTNTNLLLAIINEL